MHTGGADRFHGVDVLMRHDCRTVIPAERNQLGEQGTPLGRRQILLAQAEPAAAALEHRRSDLDQGPLRLAAVGDDEKRRLWKRRQPTAVNSRAEMASSFFSRSNRRSDEIRAWPTSRQVRNLSNSSGSPSGSSAWPRARRTFSLWTVSPLVSSIVTWSYTEAPTCTGS